MEFQFMILLLLNTCIIILAIINFNKIPETRINGTVSTFDPLA